MDTLWAPWRIDYIRSDKTENGCIFCNKAKSTTDFENLILFRGKTCFVIMNYYPYNNGHLMVVPYRHTSDFHELTGEEKIEIMNLLDTGMQILREDMRAQGFNLGVNVGHVAGAGIAEHLHFHIVPRWGGDTNFMPVTGHTKVISEALEETGKRLTEKFARAIK